MPVGARAARIPTEQWDGHRSLLESLYIHQNLNLTELIRVMSHDHGFDATDKQYKRQLAIWGIRKNVSTKEMTALLENPGQESTVRGRQVPNAKLARFKRRQKLKVSRPCPKLTHAAISSKIAEATSTASPESIVRLPPSLSMWSNQPRREWSPQQCSHVGLTLVDYSETIHRFGIALVSR